MKPYLQYRDALLLFLSFILVFIWEKSQLADLTVPAIGFLVFLFLIISIKNKKDISLGGPINFFILNAVLLLFIFSTGGLTSNLFFILYFLLFGAAFVMNPRVVFIYPIGAILIFYSQILEGDIIANLIKIISLILITPLAYFFGKQFIKNEKQADEVIKIKEREIAAANQITEDVEKVLKSSEKKLDPDEVATLSEILEETEDLREEKDK